MAAGDYRPSLLYLAVAALKDLLHDLEIEAGGEADKIHGDSRYAAHGIYIAEGVGRGYLAEGIWIIDDRRKEVDGLYHGEFVVYLINGGVVARVEPDQQIFVTEAGETREYAI